MRLLWKLLIVVALPAILIWAVGSYATTTSERNLRQAIQERSAAEARALMDEIDRLLHTRIANWRAYARGQLVQTTLGKSNERFTAMPDVDRYLQEEETRWQQVPTGELSPLMRELMNNELGKDLRLWLDKLTEASNFPVYGEVFVTNAFGANVAHDSPHFRICSSQRAVVATSTRRRGFCGGRGARQQLRDVFRTDLLAN